MKQPGRPVMAAAAVPVAPRLIGRAAELEVLSGLLDRVAERGGALVVRGEPGVGKTVLLDSLLAGATGWVIARVAGVESEMELAFAGLHQLCGPFLDRLGLLPGPQRDALAAAFGVRRRCSWSVWPCLACCRRWLRSGLLCAWWTMRSGSIGPRRRPWGLSRGGCRRSRR